MKFQIEKKLCNLQKFKLKRYTNCSGKGHENIQDFGKRKIFFSDKDIIQSSIKRKNKSLSDNFKVNILKEYKEAKKIINSTKLNKI